MKNKKVWYKKISNWLFIIGCVILLTIISINLYIMIQSKVNPNKVPSVFGYKPFIVLSGSMETEIHKGDLVITKIVDAKILKKNDVIAFRDASKTVTTHRIIDIVLENGEKFFITKGDANYSQDQNLVELDDVEGLYLFRLPGIGSIMSSLAKPTTIIIVLLVITVLFALGFTISTKKQRDTERKEFMEFKKLKEQLEKEVEEKVKKINK